MAPKRALSKAGAMQASVAKKKKLVKRDSEAAVSRILQTYFSQWPSSAVDVKTVRGLTLRETLLQERRARAAVNGSVSTPFIDQCKTSTPMTTRSPS